LTPERYDTGVVARAGFSAIFASSREVESQIKANICSVYTSAVADWVQPDLTHAHLISKHRHPDFITTTHEEGHACLLPRSQLHTIDERRGPPVLPCMFILRMLEFLPISRGYATEMSAVI
jgi:hypothetical protein